MGSSSLLDIVGSAFIGLLLLMVALGLNENAHKNNFQTQENLTVQQNLVALVQILERDFRRMGYRNGGNPPADSCILYGSADSVVFVGDIQDNTVMDTVTWYLADSAAFTPALKVRWHCVNPYVRMLIRRDEHAGVLAPPDTFVWGVTQFSIVYYNTFKQVITDSPWVFPKKPIPVLMQVTMELQPLVAYDTAYSTNFAFWTETRLVSRNLTAR